MQFQRSSFRFSSALLASGIFAVACGQQGSAGVYKGEVPMIEPPVPKNPAAHGELGPGVPSGFWVRPGFKVTVVVDRINNARFMAFDDKGRLYVSRPDNGDVKTYLPGPDGTYVPSSTFISNRFQIQQMQFVKGWMWFATSQGVFKAHVSPDGKATDLQDVLPQGTIPGSSGHWWRSLFVGERWFLHERW